MKASVFSNYQGKHQTLDPKDLLFRILEPLEGPIRAYYLGTWGARDKDQKPRNPQKSKVLWLALRSIHVDEQNSDFV